MKKIFFFLILFSGLNFSTNTSQAQNFPDDRGKFIKQFEKVLTPFIQEKEEDFIKDELKPMLLNTKYFSDSYFKRMVETCNLMEIKRVKYYPVIYNYVFSVYSIVKNKQGHSNYVSWYSSIEKLLDHKNSANFEDFMKFSAGFFSKGIIANDPNFFWIYRGGSYTFEFSDEPYIQFEEGNLVCLVESSHKKENKQVFIDSIVVYETIGTYNPILKKWNGKGGVISWEKVGLDREETSAEITSYSLSLKNSNFNCDTVVLTTPYFPKPIKGKLSDRAFRINREEDKIYPQFLSYEKRLKIDKIKPNVDYEGGFSLKGKDFIGVGNSQVPATLRIFNDNKTFVLVQSQLVIMNDKKINTPLGKAIIYISPKDSIFHSGLNFTYELDENLLEFVRGTSGISQSPFLNSYHQLDMYVPKLVWAFDSQEILLTYDFTDSPDKRFAKLESKNYFDERLYDQLQGLESVNPLVMIGNYCSKYNEYTFPEGKIASALGKILEQAKPTLLDLASLGFLNYDIEAKMITITQKLINFVQSKGEKIDYDNLVFISDMRPKKLTGYSDEQVKKEKYLQDLVEKYEQINHERKGLKNFGVLNLKTLELSLDAVDIVSISNAQNVAVFPASHQIVIKENRDFKFSGWIVAGKMELNSLESDFIYNTNKINLFKTEKSFFRVKPMSEQDGKEMITMLSSIHSIKGEILIDAPMNRSGKNKKIHDFPKLTVSKPSFVYYNQKSLLKGDYDSTRFYFTVDPFEMDSLDNFKESFQRFPGELTSAGIFPKMRESLKIMPDYSFGFSTKAPVGGYDFYNTNAKYDSKIILSGNGLQGAGTIHFLHSTSISKAYTFLPDSTLGYAEFENKPIENGVQYPDIKSSNAFITYIPKKDILKVFSTPTQELNMFGAEVRLRGAAFITPSGCTGYGVAIFKDANLGTKNFRFKRWEIDSDTANFNLKNNFKIDDEDPLALKTENLKSHISLKTKKGEFTSNLGSTQVEFPVNQYICQMDQFIWFMDKEGIELSKKELTDEQTDIDLVGANFISIHPQQDSLNFTSKKARYSLKEKTIYCQKVEYIDIADARIYPDSGLVVIRKKARMDPLQNATLLANRNTKFHKFVNCLIKVQSHKAFEAEGNYPYYNADSIMSLIKIKKITVDSSLQTIANGKIEMKDNFELSKQFEYYGDVRIYSNLPLLTFSGATRIVHKCDKFKKNWVSFTSEIDPQNIQIPVSEQMKSLDSIPLTVGILWRNSKKSDEIKLYPTFLSEVTEKADPIVFTASGFLQYNVFTDEFQIASKEKLTNQEEKGNYLALQAGKCSLNGVGTIKLGMDYGSNVTVDAVGTINYYQENEQTIMNLTVKYNLPIEEKSFEKIAEKLERSYDLEPMDFSSTTFEKALVEWTDKKTVDRIKSDYIIHNEYRKIPHELKSSIVITGLLLSSFNKVKFEEKGLFTNGDSAVIVSIFDKPVMKNVPLKAFFQQIYSGNGGDKFGLFISNPSGLEYFLHYFMNKKNGELLIYTNDGDLEKAVNESKANKHKLKDFNYKITPDRIFLSKFLKLFSSKEE